MKKNVKSIQVQQLVPNPIGPECIKVTKVYDWVVLSNRDRNKVHIPEECFTQIENARRHGNKITAKCSVVRKSQECELVGETPANIPDVPGAQIVTLAFHVRIRIQFFCDDKELCDFKVPVSFVDDVILCHPDGTEINCNIFDVQCSVLLNQMLGDMVVIDVIMCKDIQVEAEVKLEVEAKFCGPRPIIPIPELEAICPPFPAFPTQCPTFFPEENCLCQGVAEFDDTATISVISGTGLPTSVTGNLELDTIICDQCSLANSRFQIQFTGEDDIDQSFTFTATQLNQPTCTPEGTLTVTGLGTFRLGGQSESVQFTLNLNDNTNTVSFLIRELGGVEVLATGSILLTEDQIDVGPCDRF